MADITIAGASFSDVPSIVVPATSGGTETFYEVSGSQTISANGTYDVTTLAQIIVAVSGGSGLEYEAGTWEPSSDIARGDISFSDSHSEPPALVLLADTTGTSHTTTNSNYMFVYADDYRLWGSKIPYSSSAYRYGCAYYTYRGNSSSSISCSGTPFTYSSDNSSSSSYTYARYWATETGFKPYSRSTSRYWRSGRTYQWIAVWKP